MSKPAGIKDIAKLAGVSTATVSRTLRSPELVSQQTRDKVISAVNTYNYRPNQMGISLRTKRTNNVVAIIPDITNPFIAAVVRSLEQVAQQHGYNLLLGDTQANLQRIKHYADMVASRQADGIILFSQFMPFEIQADGTPKPPLPPMVNSCEDSGIEHLHRVMINNHQAAITATEHLLSLGHRHIACITGPLDTNSTQQRLKGLKQALKQAHIELPPEYIIEGNHQMEAGYTGTERLLKQPKPPSAIFCFNDEMAIGAIAAIQESGLQVPLHISVMGFDDIRFSRYINPPLTTVAQPAAQIGEQCMLQLLAQINQQPSQRYIELPTQLVKRGSTAAVYTPAKAKSLDNTH